MCVDDRLLYQFVIFTLFLKDFFPYCAQFSNRVKLQCVAVRICPASDSFLKAKKFGSLILSSKWHVHRLPDHLGSVCWPHTSLSVAFLC